MKQPKNKITKETTTNSLAYQLKQREAELSLLNSIQDAINKEIGMQAIYDMVGDNIRDLFDAQVVGIYTIDHDNEMEIFNFLYEDGVLIRPKPRKLDAVRKLLIDKKELILIDQDFHKKVATISGKPAVAVPGTRLPKSVLMVPMLVRKKVSGYVSIQNLDREMAFSPTDVNLMKTIANSMSVGLENARLFNEAEQRNAELSVINSVQQGLVAEMDMQGIYDLVGDKTRELFDSQVTVIATFDHDNKKEIFNYVFEDGKRFYPETRNFDNIRTQLIKKNKLISIPENAIEALKKIGVIAEAAPGTKNAKTMIFVPLSVGNMVRGYVSLQHLDRENAFSDSDIRLLSTLANSMSIALENARLFNETEQRNAELAVINSVQQGLVAQMDLQGIYDLVGNRLRDLFDAQVTGIYSFNQETGMEHFHYLFEDGARLYPEPRPLNQIRKWIIKNKSLLLVNEDADNKIQEITGEKHVAVLGTRLPKSMLFVPLSVGNDVKGCLSIQNLDRENAFSDSDIRLLSTLANSMSVALENARLFNETTRLLAETEQRNAELAVINSVQEGLVREMDMESIYSLVGKVICEVLNTQTLIIRTFDLKKELETWEFAIENGERLFLDPKPFIWANKHLIKTRESLLINENYIETAMQYGDTNKGVSKGLAPKSAIFVPMLLGGKVIGSVSLQNVLEENAFTESDVRLLNTLTNSMSVALENARLFNETTRLLAETEQRASEMLTVNNISRALVAQLDLKSLIKLIGDQMLETFRADIVYLAIHDKKANMLHFPYVHGEDEAKSRVFGNGITEKIILNKEPLLINEDLEKAYEEIEAEKKGRWVQSFLGVPIIVGIDAIGVISIQSTEKENRFNEYDLRLLKTIAANVGVAMQNAEAYEKLQDALNELKSAQQQLVQQEKLASLGQLAAGIAHEIKNPLNFVNNFSELNLELIDEIKEELNKLPVSSEKTEIEAILVDMITNQKKIHQHGTRADSIVKSMLLHSRGGNGIKEPTNINEMLIEYVNLSFHGMRAGKKPINVTLDFQLDDTISNISVIMEDVSRVILNLCNNAFDAMHERLQTKTEQYQPRLTIKTFQKNDQVVIEIMDNAFGIPLELKDKILMPFFTTKKGTEGTGLGLSITNDIIEAHGGNLNIESKQGEDSFTKFKINLPI